MRGILIRVGIIAVIAIGALLIRSYVSGNASELSVGDCFDLPPASAETVYDVQHHPCDQEHGGEVVFVGNYPGTKTDPFPSDNEVFAFLTQNCVPAYETYTGIALDTQNIYDVAWFQPTEKGWTEGDQEITCYIYRLDKAPFKGSQKKSG